MPLEAIKYDGKRLEILDQLLLPSKSVYEEVRTVQDAWEAIRSMKVLPFHPMTHSFLFFFLIGA